MATIRKLRGRWQAQVRRRGMKPRAKSFDSKAEAEKWARELETQVDRFGMAPDTKILESTTLGALLERYQREITPTKRGAVQEDQRWTQAQHAFRRETALITHLWEFCGRLRVDARGVGSHEILVRAQGIDNFRDRAANGDQARGIGVRPKAGSEG